MREHLLLPTPQSPLHQDANVKRQGLEIRQSDSSTVFKMQLCEACQRINVYMLAKKEERHQHLANAKDLPSSALSCDLCALLYQRTSQGTDRAIRLVDGAPITYDVINYDVFPLRVDGPAPGVAGVNFWFQQTRSWRSLCRWVSGWNCLLLPARFNGDGLKRPSSLTNLKPF